MDERQEYHKALPFIEAGKRLMKNEDYQLLIHELEKELAKSWSLLRDTQTSDPVMAKIQGELNQLDDIIGRARAWVELTTNFAKTETIQPDPDDYGTG
jgi:hypothetical protein